MARRLLETKFHIPPARAGGVQRSRLTKDLDAGLSAGRRLTLVCAPAGYGKTTLVAAWLDSLPPEMPAGWLSLDEADNDPARFAGYFVAIIQRLHAAAGGGALRLLDNATHPDLMALMDELLNGLAENRARLALALDDYHAVTNPSIQEALEYFIDHQPEGVHLVISTREDPPLPLARLRARGQMTEIRARDLRFTNAEADEFLRLSMKLDLQPDVVDRLEERTEGWAAGLQLAALSLRNISDPRVFVNTFHGGSRFVLDYLAEEVVRQQPAEVRDFLHRTSVLERMNASICRALTGRDDSQELLAQLEQANLFLIPLDDERNWYRYHHLFGDFLRSGLSDEDAKAAYQEASEWHENNGLVFEAVRYALAGGDKEFAADAIERALKNQAVWSGGQVATLAGWLESLPPATLQDRPMLSLHASRILYLRGNNDAAEQLINQAERSLAILQSLPPVEKRNIEAYISLYRGGIAAMRGEAKKAIALTEMALAGLPREDSLARARAAYSLGLAYDLTGNVEKSEEAYLQTIGLAEAAGVLFLAVNVRGALARMQIARGELRLAEQTCAEAVRLAGDDAFGPLGLIWSILGEISLERDDLEAAEGYVNTGLEISTRSGLQDDQISGMILLARLRAARGDQAAAGAIMEQACGLIDAYRIPRISLLGSALLARFQLADGKLDAALRWGRGFQAGRASGEVDYLHEFEELTLARVLAAVGEREAAAAVIDPLLRTARSAGRTAICLDALVQRALLEEAGGGREPALRWLEEALRLAAPENLCRVFLDEAASLAGLLPAAKAASPEFVAFLLERQTAAASPSPAVKGMESLPDPLSEQEIRVLKLIMAGKSNADIAGELVISVGTAKWHVHHVLQKLGVASRVQAVARARELGIA